jgi:hypothetical protein
MNPYMTPWRPTGGSELATLLLAYEAAEPMEILERKAGFVGEDG